MQLKNILAKAKNQRPEEKQETEETEAEYQNLIEPKDPEQHLSQGWHFIAQVNGKTVIEKQLIFSLF